MDFKDTVREIARLLVVFLGAVVLAHLGLLIATWLRAHGQAEAVAAKSLCRLYVAADESLSKLYGVRPIFRALPMAVDLIQIKSRTNGARVP